MLDSAFEKMRAPALLMPAVLTVLLVCGCVKKSDKVVATVGSEKITVAEFNQGLDEISQMYGDFLNSPAGRKQYLDSLVKEKMVISEAKRQGISKRPEVKQQLAMLEEKVRGIKQKYEKEIILDAMLKDKGALGADDVKNYYARHKDEFEKPFEIRVSQILVATQDEAERLIARIKKGENFAKLANEFSIDANTAKKGGDMGFFGRRQFVKEFEDAAYNLKKTGDISEAVKTPLGYHIIKLTGRKDLPSMKLDDENVQTEIKQILQKEKLDKWLDELSKKYPVNINEKALTQGKNAEMRKGEKNEK